MASYFKDDGDFLIELEIEKAKWEVFDFYTDEWIPWGRQFSIFSLNPFPYPDGMGFMEYLKVCTNRFTEDCIVYYSDNENFCVVKKC